MDECKLLGSDVSHIDVDIENKIRDLLNDNPCDKIAAELLAIVELAAAAMADLRTSRYFRPSIEGYGSSLISGRRFEHRSEKLGDARKASSLRVGRRLQILVVVQELDAEQSDGLDRVGQSGRRRRRATANWRLFGSGSA